MKRLSIIVPVYQVEQYIRACVESIFRQGLNNDEFEVILVNDGTHDNSFGRIADITAQQPNITIVEQANQGLSAARNTGLSKATGQYILFLDSDDVLVDNTLPDLLQIADRQTPDLIVADFKKMTDAEIDSSPAFTQSEAICLTMTSNQLFIDNFNPRECYVWRTLYRRSFLEENNLRFIPGLYFEDVPFTTECYLKAKTCVKTNHTFYIYRQRSGSIVSAVSKKKIMDFNRVIAHLWNIGQTMSLTSDERRKLTDTIFTTFSIEVWYITHHRELLPYRHEFIKDLKQRVPYLRFTNGPKQQLVYALYKLMPATYIWLKATF